LLDKLDVFESVEFERWSDQIRCPVFIPLPRESNDLYSACEA